MNLFNYNAFLLGAIVFLVISFSNLIYVWFCKIWKVKVLEFTIFLAPRFSLLKKEINGTLYKLGWLPVGAYIKPLGMEKEELEKIAAKELPFTFSGLSRSRQVFFGLTPTLVCLSFLLISLFTLKGPGNVLGATAGIFNYMLVAVKTMFGSGSPDELAKMTGNMLADMNIIAFALSIMIIVYLVLTHATKLSTLSFQDEKKPNALVKLIAYSVTIFGAYLTFWKIPKFVFSFFTFHQNISYIISFLIGLYFTGITIFIIAMGVVKLNTPRLASVNER